jgi:hypothetical protein
MWCCGTSLWQLAEVNELKLTCANLEDAVAEKTEELAQQRSAVAAAPFRPPARFSST